MASSAGGLRTPHQRIPVLQAEIERIRARAAEQKRLGCHRVCLRRCLGGRFVSLLGRAAPFDEVRVVLS
jgi:hypothetical protein